MISLLWKYLCLKGSFCTQMMDEIGNIRIISYKIQDFTDLNDPLFLLFHMNYYESGLSYGWLTSDLKLVATENDSVRTFRTHDTLFLFAQRSWFILVCLLEGCANFLRTFDATMVAGLTEIDGSSYWFCCGLFIRSFVHSPDFARFRPIFT